MNIVHIKVRKAAAVTHAICLRRGNETFEINTISIEATIVFILVVSVNR